MARVPPQTKGGAAFNFFLIRCTFVVCHHQHHCTVHQILCLNIKHKTCKEGAIEVANIIHLNLSGSGCCDLNTTQPDLCPKVGLDGSGGGAAI